MSQPANVELTGRTAIDLNGTSIGTIGRVYVNDGNGQAEWISIDTGLFGGRNSFAPLAGSAPEGDDVRLAVTTELVKDAPQVGDDGELPESQTEALYSHYAEVLGRPPIDGAVDAQTGADPDEPVAPPPGYLENEVTQPADDAELGGFPQNVPPQPVDADPVSSRPEDEGRR